MPDRGSGFLVEISDGASGTFYPDCQAGVTNTLYVATSGNDANDGISPSRPLATVAGALARIEDLGAGQCNWVIDVAAGTYTSNSTLQLDAEWAPRLEIRGLVRIDSLVSVTTVTDNSGGAGGDYTIVATVADNANMAGALIGIRGTSGAGNHEVYCGVWEVTATSGTTGVTFKCTAWNGAPPNGAITGTIVVFRSILAFNGVSGLRIRGGSLNQLAVKGSKTLSTFGVTAASYQGVQPCMVILKGSVAAHGFGDDGFRANHAGVIVVDEAAVAYSSNNGDNGFLARFAGANVAVYGRAYASGNGWQLIPESGGNGFHAQFGGHVFLYIVGSAGNWGVGYLSRNAGSLLCDRTGSATAVKNRVNFQAGPFGGAMQSASRSDHAGEVGNAKNAREDNFRVLGGGQLLAAYASSTGAGQHGFNNQGGYLDMTSAVSQNNAVNGLNADNNSFTEADNSNVSANANIQYHAEDGAYVRRFSPAGSATADPALNSRGNNQAYIEG